MSHGSMKAVVTAVAGNGFVTIAKFIGFFLASVNKRFLINAADPKMDARVKQIWQGDERIQRLQRVNSIVISPEESVLMAELELREEELFSDMSREEVNQAILFMKHLDTIRCSLERQVRSATPQAKHIFIEFVGLPDQKTPE